MKKINVHDVVCFGEVLWDILPSGAVPGGAPMNVAYHLYKLKKNPALITRVGNDGEGKELKALFNEHGVSTEFFQTDPEHETGKVYAKPNEDNEVEYEILMPVAWDFIQYENRLEKLVSEAQYFVYGSLASRNEVSKNTLFTLLEMAKNKTLDINLRTPHFNKKIIKDLLQKAGFLKINIAELQLISSWFAGYSEMDDSVKSIMEIFNIPNMVVTKGGDGAVLFMNGKKYIHEGYKIKVKDTVGSGDAFLAGLLSKLIENASPEDCLDYASKLGAFVATKTGACPQYDPAEVDNIISKNQQNTGK